MPVIKDGKGKYRVIPHSEVKKMKRVNVPDGWEKLQRVEVGDDGEHYIEYLNEFGYNVIVLARYYEPLKKYIPAIWGINEPIGWKDPDGDVLPCQWCPDSLDAKYRKAYGQYMCDECYNFVVEHAYDEEW